jgi:hypothetical protein
MKMPALRQIGQTKSNNRTATSKLFCSLLHFVGPPAFVPVLFVGRDCPNPMRVSRRAVSVAFPRRL